MNETWLTYQPKNVQFSVFTWKQRTCTVCGENICIQGQNGLCARCLGLVVIEENRPGKEELAKLLCRACGAVLHPRVKPSKTGLCHHCSCAANGRKRLGSKI